MPGIENLCNLIVLEGIYQVVKALALHYQMLISREDFLKQTFTMLVSVDGLIALANASQPLVFVTTKPQPLNGIGTRR